MPKRVTRYRVDASEVQGDDAYVILSPLSWPEMRAALAIQEEAQTARKQGDEVTFDATQIRRMLEQNLSHIVQWNWVDDDGEPLPQPKDDKGVIDQLNLHEVQWLGQALTSGSGDAQKN